MQKLKRHQKITAARKALEIPETASMATIKANYRRLMATWHPDKNRENPEACNEMTRKIISAYQTVMEYCRHYQYSFSEETVKRHLTPEQWWHERFGDEF